MPDKLQQIIEFVAQLDAASTQRVASQLEELNTRRQKLVLDTEEKIRTAAEQSAASKMDLGSKELASFEESLQSRTEKELAQIERIKEANDERYKFVIERHADAARAQQEITKALTDKEIEEYKRYTDNRDILDKRQKDVEKERAKEAGAAAGIPGMPTAGAAMAGLGSVVGVLTRSLPDQTERDKERRIAGETMEGVLKSKTPLDALVSIGMGLLNYAKLKWEMDIKRTEWALDVAGGTLAYRASEATAIPGQGAGPQLTVDTLKKLNKMLEESGQLTRQQMESAKSTTQILAREQVLGFGRAGGGPSGPGMMMGVGEILRSRAALASQRDTVIEVARSARLVGFSLETYAKQVGELSRKEGLSIEQTVQQVNQMFTVAQDIALNVQQINLTDLTRDFLELHDTMRIFGFSMEDSARMTARFATELDAGVLAVSDLIEWSTGITRADDASRAFVFQQLIDFTAKNMDRFGDVNKALTQAQGMGPLAQGYLLTAISEGNQRELKRLGLGGVGVQSFQTALRGAMQEQAATFAGPGGTPLERAAAEDFIQRTFLAPMLGRQLEGRTIEQKQALISGGRVPVDVIEKSMSTSHQKMDQQVDKLDKIERNTRKMQDLGPLASDLIKEFRRGEREMDIAVRAVMVEAGLDPELEEARRKPALLPGESFEDWLREKVPGAAAALEIKVQIEGPEEELKVKVKKTVEEHFIDKHKKKIQDVNDKYNLGSYGTTAR